MMVFSSLFGELSGVLVGIESICKMRADVGFTMSDSWEGN
jgi:hypothetical protein